MSLPRNTVLVGDALEQLRRLPDASVDAVITSPPYFQLRSYGTDGQYGLEAHVDDWVGRLHDVCQEIRRVLVPTGSLWLNLGDSYSRHDRSGAPPKSLLLGPERLVLALVAGGWRLRNHVVWAKTNPMPSSVADRLSCTWEHLFLLTKQTAYYFDLDSVRVRHRTRPARAGRSSGGAYLPKDWVAPLSHDHGGLGRLKADGRVGHPLGKNPGDVWHLATAAYSGAHFASFPDRLIERPLQASCPLRRCGGCRRPLAARLGRLALEGCDCHRPDEPGVVLDPFFGAGTVGLVAERYRRDWLGIELNPAFAALATNRIAQARPTDPQPARPSAGGGVDA
ncbi:MAG: site-specific DNA-methyltransferase [Actinomycetota bacterium]